MSEVSRSRSVEGSVGSNPAAEPTPLAGRSPTHRPTRERAIEPRRLRRAARLIADKIAPGQYAVRGVEEPVYFVDVNADIPCMCKDSEFNQGIQCKHLLYCRMREGDEAVLFALGQMMLRDQEIAAEYHRSQKRHHQASQQRAG